MTDTTTPTGDPVTWFEIGTDDPAAAHAFYGDVFGWTFDVQGPYTLVTTAAGPSPTGGIQDTSVPLPDGTPRSYAIPCVQVADVAATCAKVEAAGGKVLVPATQPPGGPTYAHVTDPAGNHVGIWTPAG